MKYLKCFEEIKNNNYTKGDYILIDTDKVMSENDVYNSDLIDKYGLIIDEPIEFGDNFLYSVAFYNYTDEAYGILSDEIIRKLTKEEIEEYNQKIAALKYNL